MKPKPSETTLVQKIDLSGDVNIEQMKCRSCGGILNKDSISVRAGGIYHQLSLLRFGLSVGGSAEMVNAHGLRRRLKRYAAKRPFAALFRDVQAWYALVRARSALRPGLSTYYFRPPGGTRRIHLRIDHDGSGVLIVDATNAIHLNPSAAIIAKFALDGLPRNRVVSALNIQFRRVKNSEVQRHIDGIYTLVQHLATTTDACPTCGLDTFHTPLFSTPVDRAL